MTDVTSMIHRSNIVVEDASIGVLGVWPLDLSTQVLTSAAVLPPVSFEVQCAFFQSLGDGDPAARFRYNMGPE